MGNIKIIEKKNTHKCLDVLAWVNYYLHLLLQNFIERTPQIFWEIADGTLPLLASVLCGTQAALEGVEKS